MDEAAREAQLHAGAVEILELFGMRPSYVNIRRFGPTDPPPRPFVVEQVVYERHRVEWLHNEPEGSYAVIKGEVADCLPSMAAAYQFGVEKYGPDGGFMIKAIERTDPIHFIGCVRTELKEEPPE